jgi:hypothetical protein
MTSPETNKSLRCGVCWAFVGLDRKCKRCGFQPTFARVEENEMR